MKWIKKGLIYGPDGSSNWAKHSALTPTPFLLNEKVIRVFAGFRDEKGISRIGYVDVSAQNPSNVLAVSQNPVLDVGIPGTFDDNGIILGDIIRVNEDVFMYYVGFQKAEKVKFLAFSGLAVSKDDGNTFLRYQKAPLFDRSERGLFIGAIHSVLIEDDGRFSAWVALGNGWEIINGKPFPQYNIYRVQSPDGLFFLPSLSVPCIECRGDEYRIGRPRVRKENGYYKMHYTSGTPKGAYFPGYAESVDGLKWNRKDDELGIELSEKGWDSRHICYPAIISVKDKTYMFYNGNDMGKDGFGYAILGE